MYDLKVIKAFPCKEVAEKHGIKLKESNGKLWGKLRQDEKTSSFNISLEKNLWNDFGLGKGGSVIDLVMELEGITKEDSIKILAKECGLENEKGIGWSPLTDRQYKEIWIEPGRATMNFKFDLNKHSIKQLEEWNKKYGVPVKELAIKYPSEYNRMISKICMEKINLIRNAYQINFKLLQDPTNNEITQKFIKHTLTNTAKELNRKVDLVQRAFTTSNNNYSNLKVNIEKDLKTISLQKETNLNKNQSTIIQQDRDKIIIAYKKLFNFKKIECFTDEQIKALKDINKVISKADNRFLSVVGIKEIYKKIGVKLESLEKEYNSMKENKLYNKDSIEKIRDDIIKTKELFSKFNTVIDGIKEATLNIKNEEAKLNITDKVAQRGDEFTI